jgi:hypothetical protein
VTGDRDEIVRKAFTIQADACESLGSPFTARVCRLVAERLTDQTEIGARVFGWPGDMGPGADSVPLRLCGALNHLVITGRDTGLAAVYPPHTIDASDQQLWAEIERALVEHAEAISRFLNSAPQTNEVRRSAVLLPGWCWLAKRFGLPLVISEVGASAGLNLFADRFRLKTDGFLRGDPESAVLLQPKWHGELPPDAMPAVIDRRGCDLAPIDPADRTDRERLLSYVWPDQRHRVERTEAAITIFSRESNGALVDRQDAADWLEHRLAAAYENAIHVVQHTIAWQYFPEAVKARGKALLAGAGAHATETHPLATLSLEADGQNPGAAISLTVWPGGETHSLGRADYHGRWVEWRNPAL